MKNPILYRFIFAFMLLALPCFGYAGNERLEIASIRAELKAGGKVNEQDSHGRTVLMKAIERNRIDIANLLLAYKADVTLADHDGSTAMHYAAFVGNVDILELLFSRGADVNSLNKECESPLMWAAYEGKLKACKYLANHGADPNLKTLSGKNASSLARDNDHPLTAKFLEKMK